MVHLPYFSQHVRETETKYKTIGMAENLTVVRLTREMKVFVDDAVSLFN